MDTNGMSYRLQRLNPGAAAGSPVTQTASSNRNTAEFPLQSTLIAAMTAKQPPRRGPVSRVTSANPLSLVYQNTTSQRSGWKLTLTSCCVVVVVLLILLGATILSKRKHVELFRRHDGNDEETHFFHADEGQISPNSKITAQIETLDKDLKYVIKSQQRGGLELSLGRNDHPSSLVTIIVPVRGRLLPLAHMTAPQLCRRGRNAAFSRVEFVFVATTKLSLDDAKQTLDDDVVGKVEWSPLEAVDQVASLSSVAQIDGISTTLAPREGSNLLLAHCVSTITIVRVGVKRAVESTTSDQEPARGKARNALPVVPFASLVLFGVAISNPSATHFVVMAEMYFPALLQAANDDMKNVSESFLDNLMAPFERIEPFVNKDESDIVVPAAVQCVTLQRSSGEDAIRGVVSQERLETPVVTNTTSRKAKSLRKVVLPFVLQPNAGTRFSWAQQSLAVTPKDVTVVDKGVESGSGLDRQVVAPHCVRRLYGFLGTDRRLQAVEQVDMVSPHCTAYDKMKFLLMGGLRDDRASQFVTKLYAELFSHELRRKALAVVAARILAVEHVMESISLVDVHRSGNVLRQGVRLSYAEVVENTNLYEEVTGKKFDRGMNVHLDAMMDTVVKAEHAAAQEYEKSGEHRTEEKLAWFTARLHEASLELVRLGRNKDSSSTEEEIGWDLSLRMQRFHRSWRVFSSNATAMFLPTWVPSAVLTYYQKNHIPMLHPSYMVDGSFHDTWGNVLIALHRSRGGLPGNMSSVIALREAALRERVMTVYWNSFCCGCCGFSSEIVHFIYPLSRRRRVHIFNDEHCFCKGYPGSIRDSLRRLYIKPEMYLVQYREQGGISVWISHNDPNSYKQVLTDKRKPTYFVGRSMYEFTKIPDMWAKNINEIADEVWVPCQFVQQVFISCGVDPHKVVIIPEAVDTFFFDPEAHRPLALPLRESHKGWRQWENFELATLEAYSTQYKFYSNFKWEPRKGWEILLRAYYDAFGRTTPTGSVVAGVSLYIQSFFFVNGAIPKDFDIRNTSHIVNQIRGWIAKEFPEGNVTLEGHFPHIVIVTEHILEVEQVELYRAMDAFVLPTRGEGWGLPTIQAMSMALPTISTNWGGNTEFMRRDNSFLIPIDGLEEIAEDSIYVHSEGKKWALPSTYWTRRYMELCYQNQTLAAAIGRRARAFIEQRFSEEAIVDIVDQRLEQIKRIVIERGQ